MQNISLSPHFTLSEMCASRMAEEHGIENIPPAEAVANLRRLCEGCLEPLREAIGLPVIITSGYRCRRLNELLVHAARKSQHMVGSAADLYVGQSSVQSSLTKVKATPSITKFKVQSDRELLVKAFKTILTDPKIDFDQLILYPSFIHVSYVSKQANRHKLTKAFGNGKYCALTREQALSLV